jgi:glycosyltransferase-like protein
MPEAASRTPGQPALRIALLTHSVNPRGGVVHTLELADALHERGHHVTVFAPALPGQSMFRETRCALELVPIAAPATDVADMVATRRAGFVKHLSRHLRAQGADQRFDILHAQDSIGGNALADLVDAQAIAGFVRTVHHLDRFDDARLAAWQQRAHERASQVFCVSQTWCDRLLRDHGVACSLVHNGVDLQRYSRTPDASDPRVATRYGLRPGAPMFLAVGGIEERKNTVRMLEAFTLFHATNPRAQLVIAGGASLLDHDEHGRRFATLLAASGLRSGTGESVVVTGTVPDADMPALFRAADALLMPSIREGFGMAVLEALASGTPAVVSRIAPFTEYLAVDEHRSHCCWADPMSAVSIADAMTRVCEPAHAMALAQCLPDVCERFSWRASAERHEILYRAHLALANAQPNAQRPLDRAA